MPFLFAILMVRILAGVVDDVYCTRFDCFLTDCPTELLLSPSTCKLWEPTKLYYAKEICSFFYKNQI